MEITVERLVNELKGVLRRSSSNQYNSKRVT